MKRITVLLTGVVLASLIGFGLATSKEMPAPTSDQTTNERSAEEHWYAADLIEETLARLELKVVHLAKRVERYNKKPYLDPKEFKRERWKRLIRAQSAEISELRKEMAWHQEQIKRLNTMSSPE